MDNISYAALIGINKYIALQGNDLNGCENDIADMSDELISFHNTPHDNIRMLASERATFDNIQERMEWLVDVLQPGQKGVLHYSGHGASVRGRNENGSLSNEEDQIICPTDMDWDRPFTDKLIAKILSEIRPGAFIFFVSDSCHSGTVDRDLEQPKNNPHDHSKDMPRRILPPIDIAFRSKDVDGLTKRGMFASRGVQDITFINEERHLLISGCKDSQTSADAFINGRYNGALTYYLIKAHKEDRNASWVDVHTKTLKYLLSNGYDQTPQLSGPETTLKTRMFA
jgi:hypothetical protein